MVSLFLNSEIRIPHSEFGTADFFMEDTKSQFLNPHPEALDDMEVLIILSRVKG